jgi:acetyl-CoA synthetase
MEAETLIPVPEDFARQANLTAADYERLYQESIAQPEQFWSRMAEERLTWSRKWDTVLEHDFPRGEVRWFAGGKLNASFNCLDRHLTTPLKNKAALIWEGDEPGQSRTLTYQQLHREVCRVANVLKELGVKKGDRVLVYLPMIPELPITMLACARIGAVHSVVFGGFSPESLVDRIDDCTPGLIVTSDGGFRGGRIIDMKKNVDAALERSQTKVETVLVVRRTERDGGFDWVAGRDHWLDDLLKGADGRCEVEEMDAEDPLFILYTSGSTGKPKGVLHTTAGYLLGASLTHYYLFDHKPDDTYWCTADIGWVTGHSYILYGPLINGATSIMFEGVPTYPDPGRFWDIVDKYQVSVFYTAPTAIRALSREGLSHVESKSLQSLRLLGTVGEPINPEAWLWYWRHIGKERCPVVDTWWQTETGAAMIAPVPGAFALKPGSATRSFFGVRPVLVDSDGNRLPDEGEATGNLCIEAPWPSMMRGVYGDPERFFMTYFTQFPGYYFTGDGATRDKDGYWWITGRVDDVLNVSGHRIGSAEVESALVAHDAVAEAAVVAFPHEIKGQGIYAYVTLHQGFDPNDTLRTDLIRLVGEKIGGIARPDVIHWAPGLPKTRSGKIMRRILRKIAEGEYGDLGDITTLADPSVVQTLVEDRQAAAH